MLFRKNVYKRIDEMASKVDVEPDRFKHIPGLECKIAENTLEFYNGKPLSLDFAEAQLLTKSLSKEHKLSIRMPKSIESYIASQELGIENNQYEWRSELIDGSFLMFNPDVRSVNSPRKYDFCSNDTSLVRTSRYIEPKYNGNLCWLGVSRDHFDRAALISNLDNEKCSVCAIPPLSKDNIGIRLLIDESNERRKIC